MYELLRMKVRTEVRNEIEYFRKYVYSTSTRTVVHVRLYTYFRKYGSTEVRKYESTKVLSYFGSYDTSGSTSEVMILPEVLLPDVRVVLV